MNITLGIAPLVSLLAGILILIVPRLLNFIGAIYLIIIGLVGLFGGGHLKLSTRREEGLPPLLRPPCAIGPWRRAA